MRACVELLDEVFASRSYADWCKILKQAKGVWSPYETPPMRMLG
jgi:hypothetical protein